MALFIYCFGFIFFGLGMANRLEVKLVIRSLKQVIYHRNAALNLRLHSEGKYKQFTKNN